jgi:hypothetical protein
MEVVGKSELEKMSEAERREDRVSNPCRPSYQRLTIHYIRYPGLKWAARYRNTWPNIKEASPIDESISPFLTSTQINTLK